MTPEMMMKSRHEKYASHTCDDLMKDAHRDILEMLNIFTDIPCPDAQDIAAIAALSKSAKYLYESMGDTHAKA